MNRTAPLAESLLGQAIRTGKPRLVTGDRRERPPPSWAPIRPADRRAAGRRRADPRRADARQAGRDARNSLTADLNMAASFANHAAVAIELARVRADQLTLARAEDHDRIAGDLHDHVIQELFALGMRLQGHAARADPATARTGQRLRRHPRRDHQEDPHQHLRAAAAPRGPCRAAHPDGAIIEEHAPQLGFTASISFAGPLDPGPGETLAHDILAVTREALSNCARHAHATAARCLPGSAGRADHPGRHRQRPGHRHPRALQRPVQHAPPRRTQPRYLRTHRPRQGEAPA